MERPPAKLLDRVRYRIRLKGYPHSSGIAGAQGCQHHHDLYPCFEQGRKGCSQPIGQT